ncbi:hypothetical protein BH09SUM1_BH09SUM1_11360 [soil metagenome]
MSRPGIWRWVTKGSPFTDVYNGWQRLQTNSRFSVALSRAAANAALRRVDPIYPDSWEFSGFSQNGEDGVIDYLCSQLSAAPNRYFLEIGASNGMENNTSFLALAKRYCGVMVEGNEKLSRAAAGSYAGLNWGVKFLAKRVGPADAKTLLAELATHTPDVFSLDIDGIDYHVAKALFDEGFRPRIAIVEYNSAFGPDRSVTVEHHAEYNRGRFHKSGLYYGVSVAGWRKFFEQRDYDFVNVDQNGVNAFFIEREAFPQGFVTRLKRNSFRENFTQPHRDWRRQFELIRDLPLVEI